MAETTIYVWMDRSERAYVMLRRRAGHWRVTWGHRDPPGGDNYLERGHHETSVRDEAVEEMLDRVRALSDEPDDAVRLEQSLRAALEAAPS